MPDQTPAALTDNELRELIAESAGDLLPDETIEAMARELLANRARVAELEEQSRRVTLSVQLGFALDLWMALGCPAEEFDGYMERNSIADTWANLLGVVRSIFRPKCGKPTDGGPCVLSEHKIGPCYSRSDAGRSEPVPHAELIEAAQAAPDGHAVTVAFEDGRWVLTGPTLTRDEAAMQARFYADRGARVVELREVRDV
jgi:hypothetical protein